MLKKKKKFLHLKKYSTENQEILNSLLESAHTLTPRPKKKMVTVGFVAMCVASLFKMR